MASRPRILLPLLLLLPACVSTNPAIPREWMSVPEAARITTVPDSVVPARTTTAGPIRVADGRLVNGDKPITEAFPAIESFDYSEPRGEVVFSAQHQAGFDIGLAASDGSAVNWIPNDPSDEVMVQWAPRGNKISYVMRTALGDVVRTFHVPSSYHFVTDFGSARIHALAWEPQAERYAVAYNTLIASDQVEMLRYEGKERKMAVPPAATIPADVLPFTPDALVLRPFDIQYNERLPVVVWVADRFEWSDARAALMKNARVATVVTKRAPGDELLERIAETKWMDSARVYIVNGSGREGISIVGDPAVPAGRYRRAGNVVSVAPAAIQSFAAGFIADHLKRTTSANGSSR